MTLSGEEWFEVEIRPVWNAGVANVVRGEAVA